MKKTRTRGFRILRNLAAAILCAVPLWGLLGCPMPTPELRFRQLEDRSLVPRSQIVYLWENPFPVRTTSSGEPRHIVIGCSGDQYSVGYLYEPLRSSTNTLEPWPVGEEPTPVPLSQPLHRNEMDTDNVLFFLQVPEEAAEAELTITGRIENLIEPVETAQGEKMAEGVWMFRYPIAGELSADYGAQRGLYRRTASPVRRPEPGGTALHPGAVPGGRESAVGAVGESARQRTGGYLPLHVLSI